MIFARGFTSVVGNVLVTVSVLINLLSPVVYNVGLFCYLVTVYLNYAFGSFTVSQSFVYKAETFVIRAYRP